MTLTTKALPGDIKSFEDFVSRALSFDHYTDFSDDNRVYLAGRKRREVMDKYAEENELAGKFWAKILKDNLEGFMVGQLTRHVEAAVLSEDKKAAIKGLSDFMVGYLLSSGAKTMIGKSMRDAIGKHVGAPSKYVYGRKEEREAMIENYIETYKGKTDV